MASSWVSRRVSATCPPNGRHVYSFDTSSIVVLNVFFDLDLLGCNWPIVGQGRTRRQVRSRLRIHRNPWRRPRGYSHLFAIHPDTPWHALRASALCPSVRASDQPVRSPRWYVPGQDVPSRYLLTTTLIQVLHGAPVLLRAAMVLDSPLHWSSNSLKSRERSSMKHSPRRTRRCMDRVTYK